MAEQQMKQQEMIRAEALQMQMSKLVEEFDKIKHDNPDIDLNFCIVIDCKYFWSKLISKGQYMYYTMNSDAEGLRQKQEKSKIVTV